tara:strand:+ start:120 stop:509 length:390 start_codon:yes stop_codon:yes gene_type:complete
MKKKLLLIKTSFHIINIVLIIIYLYPGSIFGWILYDNIKKQPQLTSDFSIFSSNHVYAFVILSIFGLCAYYRNKLKILFLYLFFISIFLELCQILIPERSFEFHDLYGNLFGVSIIFLLFYMYKFFKKI